MFEDLFGFGVAVEARAGVIIAVILGGAPDDAPNSVLLTGHSLGGGLAA